MAARGEREKERGRQQTVAPRERDVNAARAAVCGARVGEAPPTHLSGQVGGCYSQAKLLQVFSIQQWSNMIRILGWGGHLSSYDK